MGCPVYIRRTRKTHKGKTYDNYLLVESVSTPKGPRQKILCSLGSLAPAPRQHWLDLAHRLQASLAGQLPLSPADGVLPSLGEKGRRGRKPRPAPSPTRAPAGAGGGQRAREPGRSSRSGSRACGTSDVDPVGVERDSRFGGALAARLPAG